jgi:hypothetical protein
MNESLFELDFLVIFLFNYLLFTDLLDRLDRLDIVDDYQINFNLSKLVKKDLWRLLSFQA